MAEYISVGRIVAGHPGGRTVVEPGERFDPSKCGIGDDEIAQMLANDTIRVPEPTAPSATDPAPAAGGTTGSTTGGGESETITREGEPAEGL